MKLIVAVLTLTLMLAAACDSNRTRYLTEDEAEEEFGPDCDEIYDKCVGECDISRCEDACEAAKEACESQ